MTEKVGGLTGREGVSFELRLCRLLRTLRRPSGRRQREVDETRRQAGQPGREIDGLSGETETKGQSLGDTSQSLYTQSGIKTCRALSPLCLCKDTAGIYAVRQTKEIFRYMTVALVEQEVW